MSHLFSSRRKFMLFGDLHLNSRDYAIACEEAGVDSVLFHLNQDVGGGVRFAGLEIEEDSIKDSLSVLKIPAGIAIGDTRSLLYEDWEAIAKIGFSFVNMFAHRAPHFCLGRSTICKIGFDWSRLHSRAGQGAVRI